jgi:hypothetical protein
MHEARRKFNHLQPRVLKGENRLDKAKHQGSEPVATMSAETQSALAEKAEVCA